MSRALVSRRRSPQPSRSLRARLIPIACIGLLAACTPAAAAERGGPQDHDDCTVISAGKQASVDGSVMTSQTCDSHDGKTWLDIVPHKQNAQGQQCHIYLKTDHRHAPGDTAGTEYVGSIPQLPETYGYIHGYYPLMNEHQLAIGESTFGGKEEMVSSHGLLDCYELARLMAERCRTAREAIRTAGELLAEYGYNDKGEMLSIADPEEVWVMEILGPGKDKVGAVWAAQRVPDDHISVSANASRIRQIDLSDPDNFMASENVFAKAEEMGFWDPDSGRPFEFCYAYAERKSLSSRRREWRVYDLLAPSRGFDPNDENFPFSIAPDTLVSVQDIMRCFADTYEDTEFDMTKFMLVEGEDGKWGKSPYANPFMNYDQMPLWKINGGWNRKGERTLARFYCIYAFISQSRDWLPDEIGGLIWLGLDNPAMTCYVPIYCQTKQLPEPYRVGGDNGGRPAYTRDSAWWAFNRAATIAAHRWGDMRQDVAAVRDRWRARYFEEQPIVEEKAKQMYDEAPWLGVNHLSRHSVQACERVTAAYWQLGDDLWTKYDERF